MFSARGDGSSDLTFGSNLVVAGFQRLNEPPQRCRWDADVAWQRRARTVADSVGLEGGAILERLQQIGLDSAHARIFGDCPVGGSAIRLLHVWAVASYHHGWKPSLAFATEALELPFRPELRMILDVDWAALLTTPWGGIFFDVLARLADGLCARLQQHGESCSDVSTSASRPQRCDAGSAARLLTTGESTPGRLQEARRLLAGCALGLGGRLSELLRVPDVARLFKTLAALGGPVSGERVEGNDGDSVGDAKPLALGVVAVRAEVIAGTVAVIALAASLRASAPKKRASVERSHSLGTVELLVFAERLKPLGYLSGFFNKITESRCEMDFLSHFHRVFCVFSSTELREWPVLVAATMTSGLLVHPPYGPATLSCKLPEGANPALPMRIDLIDPALWDAPLSLSLTPVAAPSEPIGFAACPQPLYRVEANAEYVREWIAYHRRLGVGHWTIYDLDGSAEAVLGGELDVEVVSRFPDALGSPLLQAGNAWNPICLESIAQTQCFWRYRGRARWVLSLHSFDEYLVSVRSRDQALEVLDKRVLAPAATHTAVFRIPAVNYGGAPVADERSDYPMVKRFTAHTGKLYWHIVIANPSAVMSVNTTNARAVPPWKHQQFFLPEDLRVNHYVDALGAAADLLSRAATATALRPPGLR